MTDEELENLKIQAREALGFGNKEQENPVVYKNPSAGSWQCPACGSWFGPYAQQICGCQRRFTVTC